MKKSIILSLILLFSLSTAFAETKEERKQYPHELRIGIGDDLLNKLYPRFDVYNKTNDWSTGHLSVEYQYRINHWLGVGAMYDVNVSHDSWEYRSHDQFRDQGSYMSQSHFIMASTRFTYYNSKWVNLYAGIAVGLVIRQSDDYYDDFYTYVPEFLGCGFAGNITLFGISVGRQHWFGAFELGGLYRTFQGTDRLINFSVGYRF